MTSFFTRFGLAVILALAVRSPAAAQSAQPDPVLAGYMRLYAGDPEEASVHFEALRSRDSKSLSVWFGLLFVQQSRIEMDDSLAPAFERDIAAFIDHVEQRHARSSADTEALFYLAQAYLLRSTYRLDHDKGVWGAARDAAKSKGFADQYLKQHPAHGDAYLTLGLYNAWPILNSPAATTAPPLLRSTRSRPRRHAFPTGSGLERC